MTYMRWWYSIEKTLRDAVDRWTHLDRRARSIYLECMFEHDDIFLQSYHIHGVPTSWPGVKL
jgi:hypothetical protein